MKALPAGMQADLNNGATTHCHAWKLTRSDAVILGFTDHDNELVIDGVIYEASSGFTASAIEQTVGLSVDNMDISGALVSDSLEEDDIAAGLWDNARLIIYRVDWSDTTKRVILMQGSIGEISRGNIHFTAEMRSLAHELNQTTGRLYVNQCDADLFDSRCTVSSSGRTDVGTVTETNSRRFFRCTDASILARDNGYFHRGKLIWTSGQNNGFSMEVKTQYKNSINVAFTLWELMPFDISVGDTFLVYAGCDKGITDCRYKFDNIINFRGFPRIPGNDAIQWYARKDGDNDGGSLWGS